MKTPENIKELLKKIAALASDPGAPEGEKTAARLRLETLLTKHGLTMADLATEEREVYTFSYTHQWERKLIIQLYAMITDQPSFDSYKIPGGGNGKKIGLELTPSEAVDMEILYRHWRAALNRALEDFFAAFVSKYGLASEQAGESASSLDPAYLARLIAIMNGLNDIGDPRAKSLPEVAP